MKRDRTIWLEQLTVTGDWNEIRKLRKGFAPHQGRLKDMVGDLLASNSRADTLADHLEKVQWAVRLVSLREGKTGLIANLLPVELGNITENEICSATKQLNVGQSCGAITVPAEFRGAINYFTWKLCHTVGFRISPKMLGRECSI